MNRPLRAAAPLAMILTGVVLTASAIAANAPQGGAVNWPQADLDPAHTGFNAKEKTISRKNVGSLTQKWMAGTDGAQIYAQPVEMNGVVYALSDQGTLYAINAASGQVQWKVAAGLTFNYGIAVQAVIVNKGLVYSPCKVDSDGGQYGGHYGICAYKATTGALVWSYIETTLNGQPDDCTLSSAPVLSGNRLFFGIELAGCCSNMTAVDAATGAFVWSGSEPEFPGETAPAAADGMIFSEYNGGNGYEICALSQATGATAWCSAPYGDFNQNVTVAGGLVLFETGLTDGSGNTQLNALSEKTGSVVWQETITGSDGDGSPAPAVAHGIAYFSSGSNGYNSLYAVDLKTGAQVWIYSGGAAGYLASGASVANGVVYALCDRGGNGGQCAFDAKTGAVLLSEGNVQDEYGGPAPIVVNGAEIYVCGASNLCDSAP